MPDQQRSCPCFRVSGTSGLAKYAPTFMPFVSMEELAMIMSCTHSNPCIRKQLNLLLASAKVSSGPRQSFSTAADDDQSVFGREEPARLDEETMNLTCLDTVTWDSLPRHHVPSLHK